MDAPPVAEPPRLLHRHLGYTSSPHEAMPAEPEAVPAGYQHALTRRATRTARERRQTSFDRRRQAIEAELDGMVGEGLATRNDLRMIRRELERIARRPVDD